MATGARKARKLQITKPQLQGLKPLIDEWLLNNGGEVNGDCIAFGILKAGNVHPDRQCGRDNIEGLYDPTKQKRSLVMLDSHKIDIHALITAKMQTRAGVVGGLTTKVIHAVIKYAHGKWPDRICNVDTVTNIHTEPPAKAVVSAEQVEAQEAQKIASQAVRKESKRIADDLQKQIQGLIVAGDGLIERSLPHIGSLPLPKTEENSLAAEQLMKEAIVVINECGGLQEEELYDTCVALESMIVSLCDGYELSVWARNKRSSGVCDEDGYRPSISALTESMHHPKFGDRTVTRSTTASSLAGGKTGAYKSFQSRMTKSVPKSLNDAVEAGNEYILRSREDVHVEAVVHGNVDKEEVGRLNEDIKLQTQTLANTLQRRHDVQNQFKSPNDNKISAISLVFMPPVCTSRVKLFEHPQGVSTDDADMLRKVFLAANGSLHPDKNAKRRKDKHAIHG